MLVSLVYGANCYGLSNLIKCLLIHALHVLIFPTAIASGKAFSKTKEERTFSKAPWNIDCRRRLWSDKRSLFEPVAKTISISVGQGVLVTVAGVVTVT